MLQNRSLGWSNLWSNHYAGGGMMGGLIFLQPRANTWSNRRAEAGMLGGLICGLITMPEVV